MLTHLTGDLGRKTGACVVHREQNRADLEGGIELGGDQAHRAQQLPQTFEGVVLALDRDEDLVRTHQRVQGEKAQARRAVDKHIVQAAVGGLVVIEVGADRAPKLVLARHHRHELDLGTGQIEGGGGAPEALDLGHRHDRIGERDAIDEDVVHARDLDVVIDSKGRRGVSLRVEVDHEHRKPLQRKGCREIDRRCGLADATLLVRHRDDASVRWTRQGVAETTGLHGHCRLGGPRQWSVV